MVSPTTEFKTADQHGTDEKVTLKKKRAGEKSNEKEDLSENVPVFTENQPKLYKINGKPHKNKERKTTKNALQ